MPDMLFILLLALVLLGPKKLPQIAAQIGKYLAQFQRMRSEVMEQVRADCFTRMKPETRNCLTSAETKTSAWVRRAQPRPIRCARLPALRDKKIVALDPSLLHQREVQLAGVGQRALAFRVPMSSQIFSSGLRRIFDTVFRMARLRHHTDGDMTASLLNIQV